MRLRMWSTAPRVRFPRFSAVLPPLFFLAAAYNSHYGQEPRKELKYERKDKQDENKQRG